MRLLRPLAFSFFLLATQGIAHADVFCVTTVTEFQQALTAARNNGKNDFIHVVRGTYHLNTALGFSSSEAFGLNIAGGFDPDCATRTYDAAVTVVDGDNVAGILYLSTVNDFEMRYLTLRKGHQPGVVVNIDGGAASQVVIANTIIADNVATSGYVMYVDGDTITLKNNLIVRNSSSGGNFGFSAATAGHFTNNTVSGNILTDTSNSSRNTFLLGGPGVDASNNIFWGNSNALDIYAAQPLLLTDNDYQHLQATIAAGSSGNVNVDPKFASSSNFHLLPTSPLVNVGAISPPGGVTPYDLEGNDRVLNNQIDLGAYEHDEEIFFDGFE